MIMLGSTRGDESDSHAGQGWTYVAVEGDIDAHHERAKAAGAEITQRARRPGVRLARLLGEGSRGQRLVVRDIPALSALK